MQSNQIQTNGVRLHTEAFGDSNDPAVLLGVSIPAIARERASGST